MDRCTELRLAIEESHEEQIMFLITSQRACSIACHSFEQAPRHIQWRQMIANLFKQQITLHRLDDVRQRVRITHATDRGIDDISVESIVGSVSKGHNFTANFLPVQGHLLERWTKILVAMESMQSMPPIKVYKMGAHYYVIDGHHRVSIAKWRGVKEIAAHVIEIRHNSVACLKATLARQIEQGKAAEC